MSWRSTIRRWLGFVERKPDPEIDEAVRKFEEELARYRAATEDIKRKPRAPSPSLDDLTKQVEQSDAMMEEAFRKRSRKP